MGSHGPGSFLSARNNAKNDKEERIAENESKHEEFSFADSTDEVGERSWRASLKEKSGGRQL
jgi:hypothetical protein